MKKRLIVLLGASALLFTSCSSDSGMLQKCKDLYEGKSYIGYQAVDFSYQSPVDEIKEGDQSELTDYLTYQEEVKLNTVHNLINVTLFTGLTANFLARCDNEAAWAKDDYGEEFTYEMKNEGVAATFVSSKTVTDKEKEEAGVEVAYAFSYYTFYNSEGLITESKFIFDLVKENAKKELVSRYHFTSIITSDWAN